MANTDLNMELKMVVGNCRDCGEQLKVRKFRDLFITACPECGSRKTKINPNLTAFIVLLVVIVPVLFNFLKVMF